MEFLVEIPVPIGIPVTFVETYVGIEVFFCARASKVLGIKPRIRIQEQSLHRYIGFFERSGEHLDLYLYVVKIIVVSEYRLRHGQRKPLFIGQVHCVGSVYFFSLLVFDLINGPDYRCMVILEARTGEVQKDYPKIFIVLCDVEGVKILKCVVSEDYVQIYFKYCPSQDVSTLVKKLKGRSSRKLQEKFPELWKRY